jgi:hypothetical protein
MLRRAPELTTGAKSNLVAAAATGDYLVFFNDDDWYAPNTIERLWRERGDSLVGIGTLLWFAPALGLFSKETTRWIHHPWIAPRKMALSVRWPDIMDGEDIDFFRRCSPRRQISDFLYVGIQHTANVFNRQTRRPPAITREEAVAVLGDECARFFEELELVFSGNGAAQ